jgi:hypothetical protein
MSSRSIEARGRGGYRHDQIDPIPLAYPQKACVRTCNVRTGKFRVLAKRCGLRHAEGCARNILLHLGGGQIVSHPAAGVRIVCSLSFQRPRALGDRRGASALGQLSRCGMTNASSQKWGCGDRIMMGA